MRTDRKFDRIVLLGGLCLVVVVSCSVFGAMLTILLFLLLLACLVVTALRPMLHKLQNLDGAMIGLREQLSALEAQMPKPGEPATGSAHRNPAQVDEVNTKVEKLVEEVAATQERLAVLTTQMAALEDGISVSGAGVGAGTQQGNASLSMKMDNLRAEITSVLAHLPASKELKDLETLRNAGIASAVEKMDFAALFRRAQPGETVWWYDTFTPDYIHFLRDLSEARRRGVNIIMFIQSPQSDAARKRATELGESFGERSYHAGLGSFLTTMLSLAQQSEKGRFEIVVYADDPGRIALYVVACGNKPLRGYMCPLLSAPTGLDCHHFVLTPSPASGVLEQGFTLLQAKYNRWKKELRIHRGDEGMMAS